jgi:hypothetical protein
MSQSREPHEPFVRHGDQLDQFIVNFWRRQVDAAENEPPPYGRHPPLPLARIKKVMKSDPDVRVSAQPLFACRQRPDPDLTATSQMIASDGMLPPESVVNAHCLYSSRALLQGLRE